MNEIDIFSSEDEINEEEKIDEEHIFKDEIKNIGKKLAFSDGELNQISSLARERKFVIPKTDLLYNKDYFKKCEIFIHNYRFLKSIQNSFKGDESIKLKIEKFISPYEKLYIELLTLYASYNKDFEYGKSSIQRRITNILIFNEEKINIFIDELYSLGKVVSQYSPDDDVGVQ